MPTTPGDEITHEWQPPGWLPCCGVASLEVPYWHRFTLDPAQRTCNPVADARAA